VTDENDNVVQTLDYYPYGATRVSVATSTNEKRKFIGQFTDDSGLDYLNARYYNPTQGQFISQDPVFWELGLTNDGKTALSNPQSQNSYGYANDNPITGKDPLGRFLELSGSLVAPGRSWSAGIRLDSNGLDYFLSGGVGAGLSAGVELMWAPGQSLPHTNQGSVSASATVVEGVGGRISQNLSTYSPEKNKTIPNGSPSFGIVIGAGDSASIQAEGTAPIPYLVWNKPISQVSLSQLSKIPTTISGYKGSSVASAPAYTTKTYTLPNGKTADWYGNIVPGPANNSKKN